MNKVLSKSIYILGVLLISILAFRFMKHKYDFSVVVHPVAHCSNGIRDADEDGVDCGGFDCKPCGVPPIPYVSCTTKRDSLRLSVNYGPYDNYGVSVQSKSLSNGHFEIMGVFNSNSDTVVIDFLRRPLIKGHYRTMGKSFAANSKEVGISINENGLNYPWYPYLNDSSLSVQIINSKVHVYICYSEFQSLTIPYSYFIKDLELVEN